MDSVEMYKEIADRMSVGCFIWNINKKDLAKSTVEYVNEAANDAVKSDLNKIVGKEIGKAFPELKNTDFIKVLQKVVTSKKNTTIDQFQYGDADIENNFFRVEIVPLEHADKVALLFFNISPQLRAESELKESLEKMTKLNDIMIGRELKMKELKEEISELKNK